MCRFQISNALFGLPNLIDSTFDGINQLRVHLLLIVQKPRTLRSLGHITQNHHRMVERVMPEVRANTTIGRQRFIFEFIIINKLRFINEEPRKRQRVRRARAVLANDNGDRAIIESHHMLIIRRFRNRLRKRPRRFASHHIMHTFDVSPPFPSSKQAGKRVG